MRFGQFEERHRLPTMPTTVITGSSRGSFSRVPRDAESAEKIAMATINLGYANRRQKLLHRSLANDNLQRRRRATAYQAQITVRPTLSGPSKRIISRPIDWPTVPGGNNIADSIPRARKVHPDQGSRPERHARCPRLRSVDAGSRFTAAARSTTLSRRRGSDPSAAP